MEYLVARLPQGLRDLVLPVALHLEERRLQFADHLLGTRNLRRGFPSAPLDLGKLPLEGQEPRAPLEALVDQIDDRRRLVPDDVGPLGRGDCLGFEACNLLLDLQTFFPNERDL